MCCAPVRDSRQAVLSGQPAEPCWASTRVSTRVCHAERTSTGRSIFQERGRQARSSEVVLATQRQTIRWSLATLWPQRPGTLPCGRHGVKQASQLALFENKQEAAQGEAESEGQTQDSTPLLHFRFNAGSGRSNALSCELVVNTKPFITKP